MSQLNAKYPIVYTVPATEFERVIGATHRHAKHASGWTTYETHTQTVATINAGFEITINIPKIVEEVLSRAMRNKNGRASAYGGIIKAKATSSRKVSERTDEMPVREGCTITKVIE